MNEREALPQERRTSLRWPAAFPVLYGSKDDMGLGTCRDISEGGMCLEGMRKYPAGSRIEIQFQPALARKSDEAWVRMTAEVRHVGGSTMGLRFTEISGYEHACLLETIYQLISLRRR